jgi:hypothetical protein
MTKYFGLMFNGGEQEQENNKNREKFHHTLPGSREQSDCVLRKIKNPTDRIEGR